MQRRWYATPEEVENFIRRWNEGEWDRNSQRMGQRFINEHNLQCCMISKRPCIFYLECPGKIAKLIWEHFIPPEEG